MTDKELMQQALEALEISSNYSTKHAAETYYAPLIQALRERLAQTKEHTTRIVTDANGRKHITNKPLLRS